jgi:hypothetical protein
MFLGNEKNRDYINTGIEIIFLFIRDLDSRSDLSSAKAGQD